MVMKNVKDVKRGFKQPNYFQVDHKVEKIFKVEGVDILPSPIAWQKLKWTRKYFLKKPKEGYFVWIKKQIDFPFFICVSIAKEKTKQKLSNLLMIEKNLNISLLGTCNALKKRLSAYHKAKGKIILKENSILKYEHIHSWGQEDVIEPDYEFFLEKNSKLDYTYKDFFSPKELKIKTKFNLFKEASSNINIIVDCINTKVNIEDIMILKGKNASGILKLRLVGKRNSKIKAHTQILADAQSKGHLDCQGLLIDKNSEISLSPQLVCKNKLSQITHEASIGKVSEEELTYLRMRGFDQKQAIDLIVNGFLSI